jgi:hypothetical protein
LLRYLFSTNSTFWHVCPRVARALKGSWKRITLSGVGLLIQSSSMAFIFPLLYTALWMAWIKGREEPALERRFGDDYRRYREEKPFLVPRLLPRKR